MTTVGMVGTGQMGAGLGWALRDGGHEVVTTLAGRSARSARLATDAGLRVLPSLSAVLAAADVVLVVVPPGAAPAAAAEISAAAPAGALVADLNAVAPTTAQAIAATLARAGLDCVDGSISGPAPTVRPGARIYLSGPRAAEIAALRWRHVTPIVVGDQLGAASAVKMSTASVYKGLGALVTQAVRAATTYGVLDHVRADLGEYASAYPLATSAAKAHRYVAEMREIAVAQSAVGLTPALFEAIAQVWADVAGTPLAATDPESVDPAITLADVAERL
jgi:3-hydroxyisobutyrate dehydrogenase-like beta-hydroxyacid dehydrogenase